MNEVPIHTTGGKHFVFPKADKFRDGDVVKLPDYMTNQFGRIEYSPTDETLHPGFVLVRLPAPSSALVLLPVKDLTLRPIHDCPNCDCSYPPSDKKIVVDTRDSNLKINPDKFS